MKFEADKFPLTFVHVSDLSGSFLAGDVSRLGFICFGVKRFSYWRARGGGDRRMRCKEVIYNKVISIVMVD